MYSKSAKRKLTTLAKAGSVVLLGASGAVPQTALAATCDGCGAEIWIPSGFKEMLKEGNHRTFCLQCLHTRKVA
jgi:hypothetical protein